MWRMEDHFEWGLMTLAAIRRGSMLGCVAWSATGHPFNETH